MFCENCGYEIPEGDFVCENCGTPIDAAPAETGVQPEDVEATRMLSEDEINQINSYDYNSYDRKPGSKKAVGIIIAILVVVLGAGGIGGFMFMKNKKETEYANALEQGMLYLEMGHYDDAIASFEEAEEIMPQECEPYVYMADAYTQTGNTEKAKAVVNKGEKKCNNKEQYHEKLVEVGINPPAPATPAGDVEEIEDIDDEYVIAGENGIKYNCVEAEDYIYCTDWYNIYRVDKETLENETLIEDELIDAMFVNDNEIYVRINGGFNSDNSANISRIDQETGEISTVVENCANDKNEPISFEDGKIFYTVYDEDAEHLITMCQNLDGTECEESDKDIRNVDQDMYDPQSNSDDYSVDFIEDEEELGSYEFYLFAPDDEVVLGTARVG